MVLLTIVTMLYITSPGLWKFVPFDRRLPVAPSSQALAMATALLLSGSRSLGCFGGNVVFCFKETQSFEKR